jgi:hypothetical protein
MKDINKKFSVRYYLNLVLVDEEDRRYFKQQEIILWRKGDRTRKPFQVTLQQQYKQMQNPNVALSSNNSLKESQSNEGISNAATTAGTGQEGAASNNENGAQASTNDEQPTPDKEFQTVINSKTDGDRKNSGTRSGAEDETPECHSSVMDKDDEDEENQQPAVSSTEAV